MDAETSVSNPAGGPSAGPGPRRVYLRSERQREASRRNIRRAQQAACDLMNAPGYQPSPQRQDANRANLQRAKQVKLHDQSYRYASCFRDGLSAASLERSVGMSGENLEEYRAHLQRFQRVFTQGIDEWANAAGIRKLATALGQASWRRLRIGRTLPEWEVLAVCHGLHRLIEARREDGDLTETRLAEWARELDYTLEDGRLWAWKKARALDNRIEALACQLLFERGENIFHRRARLSPVVLDFEQWTAEVLGNPLLSAPRVLVALGEHRPDVADTSKWRAFGSGSSSVLSLRGGAERDLPGCEGTLLPQGRKREAEGEASAPRCFEDFVKLVNEALGAVGGQGPGAGEGLGVRDQGLGAGGYGSESLTSDPGPRPLLFEPASLIPNPQPLTPVLDQPLTPVLELAQSLWERLQFFRQQGETETAGVQALFRGYTCSLSSEDATEADAALPPESVARKLVDSLMQGEQAFLRVQVPEYRVKRALYALLVKRYGEQPEFKELKPPSPDISNLLVRALLLNAMDRKAEAEQLLNLANEIDAAARGEPPPVPSHEYQSRSQ